MTAPVADGTLKGAVTLKMDNGESDADALKDKLVFTWKANGETALPNAGSYQLTISIEAIPEVCKAASITSDVNFVIRKAEIKVNIPGVKNNTLEETPGTTVDALSKKIRDNYTIAFLDSNEVFTGDKDVFVKDPVVSVREVGQEAPLEGTAELLRNKDYFLSFSASVTDGKAANYTLAKMDEIRLVVGDLIETQVIATKKTAGQEISKTYDGNAVNYDTDVAAKVDFKVETVDEDEKKVVELDSTKYTLSHKWVIADSNNGKNDKYIELGEGKEPVDAGTYYAEVEFDGTYDGKIGVYKPSKTWVKVVIEPIGIYLQPTGAYTFYEGTPVSEIIRAVEYQAALVNAGSGSALPSASDLETMWGVSYNQPDKTQYYVPIFKVQRAIKQGEGADEKIVSYRDVSSSYELKTTETYRIVFSGKKGVFRADGTVTGVRDINEAAMESNTNYAVAAFTDDTAVDVGTSNALAITVTPATEVEIDTTAILVKEAAIAENYKAADAKPVIYDGNPVFSTRQSYKQAVVKEKAAGAEVAKNDNPSLKYVWHRYYGELKEELGEDGKPVMGEDGKPSMVPNESDWNSYNDPSAINSVLNYPEDAGIYKLAIFYKDESHAHKSASKDVYVVIEPQLLKAMPDPAVKFEAFTNTHTSAFLEKLEKLETPAFKIYKVENNDEEAFDKLTPEARAALELTEEDIVIDPYVVKANDMDANGVPVKDSYELYRGTFEEFFKQCYGVESDIVYDDGEELSRNYKTATSMAPITVTPMGDIEIELRVDQKLSGKDRLYDGTAFTLTDDEKKALVKVFNKTTNVEITDFPYDKLIWKWKYTEPKETSFFDHDAEEVLNAGTYTLKVSFEGNEIYKNTENPDAGSITIQQRKITLSPKLNEGVKAGAGARDLYDPKAVVIAEVGDGLAAGDEGIFTWVEDQKYLYDEGEEIPHGTWSGYPALFTKNTEDKNTTFTITVHKKDETEPYYGYLRYNTEYQVKLAPNEGLAEPYRTNYDVTYAKVGHTVAVRGESTIESTTAYKAGKIKSNVTTTPAAGENGKTKITITPLAGIPFYKGKIVVKDPSDDDETVTVSDSNFFQFDIVAPAEFKEDKGNYSANFSKFVFKNAFLNNEKAHLLNWYESDGTIRVLVDAAAVLEEPAGCTFSILWEDGYEEDFEVVINKDLLEADLTKAVSPKALKFNGVNTKMVVGETQQLDVKVTKTQITDIICLGYEVVSGDSVSVNDTGYLTALKIGSSKVRVFAARMVDGKKQELTGKEAKSATVTINVKAVPAPAIKKIIPADTHTTMIGYTKVSSGYRREIYFREGKGLKATDFETAISGMKDNDWKAAGFAAAPVYKYEDNERYNSQTKLIETYDEDIPGLDTLTPDKDYTIYVRNISGIRTLEDGSVVATSAAGSVKSFKTTKSQLCYLDIYFDTEKQPDITYNTDEDELYDCTDNSYYSVNISKKAVQVSVDGYFREAITNSFAETDDRAKIGLLPLDKNALSNYLAPKLVFSVTGKEWDEDGEWRYTPTNLATINNKGRLSLKGTGTVWVHVYDAVDSDRHDVLELDITGNPTSVTGKKVKLRVGEEADLYELLQYKQDKVKLTEYEYVRYHDVPMHKIATPRIINIDEVVKALEDGGYDVQPHGVYRNINHLYITPLTDKAATTVNVNIRIGNANDGTALSAPAVLKLTTQALDPVKSLKQEYIEDDSVLISFKHTGICDGFNIEIKDTRNVVRNVFKRADTAQEIYTPAQNNSFRQFEDEEGYDRFIDNSWKCYYAKGSYTYYCRIDGIKRQSKYTVSVNALYENEQGTIAKSKAASKKITTTKIPSATAYVYDLRKAKGDPVGEIRPSVQIDVCGDLIYDPDDPNFSYDINMPGGVNHDVKTEIGSVGYFTSGSTYTLFASGTDPRARRRVTDTLTWTSTNKKVATVKANPGTYTATLNTVKNGTTYIELKSKITKKVIARHKIYVKAVGEAGPAYAGSYDPSMPPFIWDWDYTSNVEVLTTANPVRIRLEDTNSSHRYTWVSFTAPAFGRYTFSKTGNLSIETVYSYAGKNDGDGTRVTLKNGSAFLKAGQTIYFKVNGEDGTVSATGTKFSTLVKGIPVKVTDSNEYFSFTAPADNVYTFATDRNSSISAYSETGSSRDLTSVVNADGTTSWCIALDADETIYLKTEQNAVLSVTDRVIDKALDGTTVAAENLTVTKDKPVWISFKAPVGAAYTFTAEGGSDEFMMEYFKDPQTIIGGNYANYEKVPGEGDTAASTWKAELTNRQISKDDIVVLKLSTEIDSVTIGKFMVDIPANAELKAGTPTNVNIVPGKTAWITFVPAEAGRYTFSTTAGTTEKPANVNWIDVYNENYSYKGNLKSGNELIVEEASDTRTATGFVAGETYYLEVSVSSQGPADDTAAVPVTLNLTKQTVGKLPATGVSFGDNSSYWYMYIADTTGLYVFEADVTANAEGGTHTISAQQYASEDASDGNGFGSPRGNGFYQERHMNAGEKLVLKVYANSLDSDTVKTTANINASKVSFEPFTASASISLDKDGATKWYSFTADATASYTFTKATAEGNTGTVDVHYAMNEGGRYNSFNTSITRTLSKGETIYFKAVQSGDTTAVATLSVSKPEAFKGDAITLTNTQRSQTYTFTAPLTDYYVSSVTSSETAVGADVTLSDDNGNNYNYNYNYNQLTFGQTYRMRVTMTGNLPADKESVTVNVSLTPRSEAAKANGQTATVKAGASYTTVYYAYTPTEAGRYNLSLSRKENSTVTGSISRYIREMTVRGRNVDYSSVNSDGAYLKANATYCVSASLSNSGTEDEAVTLAAQKITASGALQMENNAEVTLKANEEKYYSFTAAADGDYTFTATPADNVDITVWKEAEDEDAGTWVSLKSGESVLVRFSASTDVTFTPGITAAINETLSTADADFTVKKGETKKFVYRVLTDGLYTIKSDFTGKDGVNVESLHERSGFDEYGASASFVWEPDSYAAINSVYQCYQKNELYFFITNNSDADLTLKLHAERITPVELQRGQAQNFTVAKDALTWVTFKAPADGRYALTATNSDKLDVKRYNNGLYDISDMPGYYLYQDEDEGTHELTFAIHALEENTETSLTMNTFAGTPLETNVKTSITVPAGGTVWYQYTSDSLNQYEYKVEKAEDSDFPSYYELQLRPCIWELNDSKYVYLSNGYSSSCNLGASESMIFGFRNDSDTEAKFDFTVTKVSEALAEGNEVKLEKGTSYFSFRLPQDGVYRVTYTDSIWSNSCNNAYWYNNGNRGYYIIGDQRGEILLTANSYNEAGTIQIDRVDLSTLSVDDSVEESIEGNATIWAAFTPDESGNYSFNSNYSAGFFYKDIDGNWNWDYNSRRYLERGRTVYIGVRNYNDYTVWNTLSVKKE